MTGPSAAEEHLDARTSARRTPAASPARFSRVFAYIRSNPYDACSLPNLARAASMSPFHFCRTFRLVTGVSPHQYVMLRRMQKARLLLESTKLPLREVARLSGFATQAHFANVFKREVGVTPGRYRATSL